MKYQWITINDVFDEGNCKRILDEANNNGYHTAKLGNDTQDSNYIDPDIRSCLVSDIPIKKYLWVESKLTNALRQVNQYFKYDLDGYMDLQVIQYNVNSYFKPHLDIYSLDTDMQRKITFVIQLSKPEDYTGGELKLYTKGDPDVVPKTQGTMIAFPSYLLHEVSPILSGQRYTSIGWCFGKEFR